MAFWDTSAVFKLYVRERDSERVRAVIRISAETPIISQLSLAEMYRALWAKELARAIPSGQAGTTYQQFSEDVAAGVFAMIPFGRDVQDEFERIVPICYRASPVVPVRALDGLLLASALMARTPELVSTDSRMRKAGALFGLRVLPEQDR
jgi:predicted nucleic acid-binding protein